jgi:hypothetical protein
MENEPKFAEGDTVSTIEGISGKIISVDAAPDEDSEHEYDVAWEDGQTDYGLVESFFAESDF